MSQVAGETMQESASAYRWVVMGIWVSATVVAFMIVSTIGILMPGISEELGLSPFQQGMLGSAAYWGNLTMAIPVGWWASRFAPKILTTVTMVLGALCLLAQALSPGFAVLILGRVAFGITIIARQPARAFLTQQWFPSRQVVLLNSISNAMFGLVVGGGVAAAPFVFAALGDNWRATLLSFVAVFAGMTVIWMIFGRERETSEYRNQLGAQDVNVLSGALRHRDLWIGGAGFVGATTAFSGFLSFYPTFMLDTHQTPLVWSGAILALGIFAGGASGLALGWVATTYDRGRTILLVNGVVITVTFVGMTMTGSLPLLLTLTFLNGAAFGFWPVLYSSPFHLPGIRPREIAVSLAFIQMSSSGGIALGPLITGAVQQATGDLQLALEVVSFTGLILSVSGLLMRHGLSSRVASDSAQPATPP